MSGDIDKTWAGIAKGMVFVGCVALGLYLRAIVLAYGWNRFAVVGLGAHPLTPAMAFGIALLLLTAAPLGSSGKDNSLSDLAWRAILFPLFGWALLAITWEIAS